MLTRLMRSQHGVTLVEMLVVLVLLGVVGGVVLTAIVTAFDSASVTTSRSVALNEIETALQRVSRDLRTADAVRITNSPSDSIEVLVTRGENTSNVTYTVEGGSLIREDSGQTLVTVIDNASDQPVFRYLDRLGVDLIVEADVPCQPGVCPVDQIEITIVRGIEGRSPVVSSTKVAVRNNVRYGSS